MTANGSHSVVVTVPVHNEAPRILGTLKLLRDALDESGLEYSLAVAEDGSTDGTKEILAEAPHEVGRFISQSGATPLGRGRALRTLWGNLSADAYCFTDADLAAGTAAVLEAIRLVLSGEDVVTGSRYAHGATVNRPPLRLIASKSYNSLIRLWFRTGIRDHQCGLKVFSRHAVQVLLPVALEDSWFWDTQVLVMAKRLGVGVREIPVSWVEKKARQTSLGRLFSDVYLHGSGLLRLKGEVDRLRTTARPELLAAGAPRGTSTFLR